MPPKSTHTFKIPEIHFPLVAQCVQAFYADCVAQLSKAMGSLAPENSVLLARYFYLRGLVQLMQGQLLDALLDFQSLYKTDVRVFPTDLVQTTVESLSAPERTQAERMPELRRLISEVMDRPADVPKADDRVKNFELPKKHMQLDDFVKRVQESGIVKDTVIIHRLFKALTVGRRMPAAGGALDGRLAQPGRALCVWGSLSCGARQAPLSMGFSRPECWSGLPCAPPGDLPDPGIKPGSPALKVDSLLSEPPLPSRKPHGWGL